MKKVRLLSFFLAAQSSLSIIFLSSILSAYAMPQKDLSFPSMMHKQDSIWGPTHSGNQTSTGTRDVCLTDVPIRLTVLGPDTNYGRTFSASPILWFYVPYTSNQISHGEFVLQNEDEYDVIEPVTFKLPNNNEDGLVSLSLLETSTSLESDQKYSWSFELFCSEDSPSSIQSPIFIEGWIHALGETSMPQQLDASANVPYEFYRTNLIWFDAINALISHQDMQTAGSPANISWNELMQEGNVLIDDITSINILGPVTIIEK